MSWWDTSGITNLASQALKNAQKKIDKVLDIEEEKARGKGTRRGKTLDKKEEESKQGEKQDVDFWSTWMSSGENKNEEEKKAATASSWNLPWNMGSDTIESQSVQEQVEEIASSGSISSSSLSQKEMGLRGKLLTSATESQDYVSQSLLVEGSDTSNVLAPGQELDCPKALDCMDEESQQFNSQTVMKERKEDNESLEGKPVRDTSVPEDTKIKLPEIHPSLLIHQTDDNRLLDDKKTAETDITSDNDRAPSTHSSENDDIINSVAANSNDTEQGDSVFKVGESSQNVSVECVEEILKNELSTTVQENSGSEKEGFHTETHGPGTQEAPGYLNKASLGTLYESLEGSVPDAVLSSVSHTSHQGNDSVPTSTSTVLPEQSNVTDVVETEHCLVVADSATSISIDDSVSRLNPPLNNEISDLLGNAEEEGDHLNEFSIGDQNITMLGNSMNEMNSQQKSQSDFMLDYVNISSSNVSVDQNVISDRCDGGLDDLQTSSECELGNSRTSSDLDMPEGRTSSTGSSDTSKLDSSIDTVVDRSAVDILSDVEPVSVERDIPYSLFGDRKVEQEEVKENTAADHASGSLSSSYVRCMIEEAMEEVRTEDSGSDNHSNGEKSESSKVDSELEKSIYSGHESSDDIETTTSSDIEIIQAPTPNGEKRFQAHFDLKLGQGHHRSDTDSQSSSSAHSKTGETDHLSPERGESIWRDDDFQHHDLHAVTEEGIDSPYHPERLLKLTQSVIQQQVYGGQKLAEMAEVLQARESKLIHLSKENHQLMEDKNILRSQLQQLEESREAETADLTAITEEFSARMGESEKKIQALFKDKEALKVKLDATEQELQRRSSNINVEALLEEKSEQVEQLLAEGEKLSKQQLQSSTIIKKLRAKEKETEATVTAQKKKVEEQTTELERLRVVLDSKEETEKKQADAINQLNTAIQWQEKELVKLRSELEDAHEKTRGLQVAVDNSYKEIAELHRSNATQDSKAQEAAFSAETHVREELKAAMEREQAKFRQEREAFIMQADDLRLDMARLEKEHSRREDLLRQEITHLQERLQEDESRSQDLTQSVSSATRPLLRQIENLQATYGAQSSAWEKVEKNITDRLAEAQTALSIAQEKERTANERHMELSVRVSTLEASNSRLKQEKAQLGAQVESSHAKIEELQDSQNSIVAKLETSKQKLTEDLNQLKVEKIHMESLLHVERTKIETENKKSLALQEQLRLAERERPRSRGTPSPSSSRSISREESFMGSMHEHHSPGWNWSFHEDSESGSTIGGMAKSSVYDSLRQSGAAIAFESLQSQLKLREGEIQQLQVEIAQLERTRESMAKELVDLTNRNEELQETQIEHEKLLQEFSELNGRYSAILQMYGEKEEQVQELRLDLQDVKEMYKSQIDALMAK